MNDQIKDDVKPSERIKKRQRDLDRYSVDRTHWYVMAILEHLDEQHEARLRALAHPETPVVPEGAGLHALKCWPEYFSECVSGKKTFEFRKDDRNYKENDVLVLQEFDPALRDYTGGMASFRVTYIARGNLIPDGFCVMSIVPFGATMQEPEQSQDQPSTDGDALDEFGSALLDAREANATTLGLGYAYEAYGAWQAERARRSREVEDAREQEAGAKEMARGYNLTIQQMCKNEESYKARIAELETNIERSKTVLAEVRASEAKWEGRATKAEAALAEERGKRFSANDLANTLAHAAAVEAERNKLAAELETVRQWVQVNAGSSLVQVAKAATEIGELLDTSEAVGPVWRDAPETIEETGLYRVEWDADGCPPVWWFKMGDNLGDDCRFTACLPAYPQRIAGPITITEPREEEA